MAEDHRLFVNEERTVLITVWPDGTMTVALRDSSSGVWGPPVVMREEK
jgi:hypothetical protein